MSIYDVLDRMPEVREAIRARAVAEAVAARREFRDAQREVDRAFAMVEEERRIVDVAWCLASMEGWVAVDLVDGDDAIEEAADHLTETLAREVERAAQRVAEAEQAHVKACEKRHDARVALAEWQEIVRLLGGERPWDADEIEGWNSSPAEE